MLVRMDFSCHITDESKINRAEEVCRETQKAWAKEEEIQFTSCTTTTTVKATFEWQKEQHHHDIILTRCMLFSDQMPLKPLNFSSQRMELYWCMMIFQLIVSRSWTNFPSSQQMCLRPGRGHMLPSSVTGATWPEDITWKRAKKEKGITFVPGGDIPDEVRETAWEFMGQTTPENYAKLVFGRPLSKEDAFDPKEESVMNILGEGSREREEPQDVDMEGSSPQGEEPTGSSPQGEEPAPATGSSPQGEEPQPENYDNWWETPGEPTADQLQAEREGEFDQGVIDEESALQWIKRTSFLV